MTPLLLTVSLGATAVGLGATFLLRRHPLVRRLLRLSRALATDRRLPRRVRWPITAALILELTPGPDFAIAETIFALTALQLLLFHRPTLRAILEETRS